jgi:hypothetical protein
MFAGECRNASYRGTVPVERDQLIKDSSITPWHVINGLKEVYSYNIQNIPQTTQSVTLDPSQLKSLLAGLTQRVSLIQGPPGMTVMNVLEI